MSERHRYKCTFSDFEDGTIINVSCATPREAAEQAASWWERDIEDWRVLRGEEVLTVEVEGVAGTEIWWVLGENGAYLAKPYNG